MKLFLSLSLVCIFNSIITSSTFGQIGYGLQLSRSSVNGGSENHVRLTMNTSGMVFGLTSAFEWDSSVGSGIEVQLDPRRSQVQSFRNRVLPGAMVLEVIAGNDIFDPGIIEPGSNIPTATAVIQCQDGLTIDKSTPIRFVDSRYSLVAGGALIKNSISVGGNSIGVGEGLELINGAFTCISSPSTTNDVVGSSSGLFTNPVLAPNGTISGLGFLVACRSSY